jgi:hypothetical protein
MGVLALLSLGVGIWGTSANNLTGIIFGYSGVTVFSGFWFVKKLWEWTRDEITRGLK